MIYTVGLTDDAARDFAELVHFLDRHEIPGRAWHVLNRIEETLANLSENPARGAYPPELLALGIKEYTEVFFKPYRIVYRIVGDQVVVFLIVDGRRDLQPLLQRRLMTAR